jgi:hypothetical protein
LLAATLYQGNPDTNHKLWNIVSTEIYTAYAGAAGMLLHINGKFTMGKLKSSLFCAPLLADLFLYSYEADFIQGLLKKNEMKLARSFSFTFRYIDDVLSLNNSRFGDVFHRIYPIKLEGAQFVAIGMPTIC